jgi:hypothetical protein
MSKMSYCIFTRLSKVFISFLFFIPFLVQSEVKNFYHAKNLNNSEKLTNSVPREYFSMLLMNMNDYPVQVGHDEINNHYVILPSPKILQLNAHGPDKKFVIMSLYPQGVAEFVKTKFPSQTVNHLFVETLTIYNEKQEIMKQMMIPEGVSVLPPQYLEFYVPMDTTDLTLVYTFVGRSGWSDFGAATDAKGLYEEIRKLNINSNSKLTIDIQEESGHVEGFEAYTADENNVIERSQSFFQSFVLWGEIPDRIFKLLEDLRYKQNINIDFNQIVESLNKYPELFTDMTKWQTVLTNMSKEHYTESELGDKFSASVDFSLGSLFGFKGEGSTERIERSKKMMKLNLEGQIYIPKGINFVLRKKHTMDFLQGALIRSYKELSEKKFKLGSSIPLSMPKTTRHPVYLTCTNQSVKCGNKSEYVVDGGSPIYVNFVSNNINNCAMQIEVYIDNVLYTKLGPIIPNTANGSEVYYKNTDAILIPALTTDRTHTLSFEAMTLPGAHCGVNLNRWGGKFEFTYDYGKKSRK